MTGAEDRSRSMSGVTIVDTDPGTNVLNFDLHDILVVLGEEAVRSTWTVEGVESIGGEAARALNEASDQSALLDGPQLIRLARDVEQIIDGEFTGYLPNSRSSWISIRAVDSSAYDVVTEREDVLRSLRAKFASVQALPV